MDKTNRQILLHMLDYIRQIDEANSMFHADIETLKHNSVYRNAVALCVLQIGELAGKLTEDFRQTTSGEIPWRAVRGLRNIVAHHYGKIDDEALWETISLDIPALTDFCNRQLQRKTKKAGERNAFLPSGIYLISGSFARDAAMSSSEGI